jgi:hypothetical protein
MNGSGKPCSWCSKRHAEELGGATLTLYAGEGFFRDVDVDGDAALICIGVCPHCGGVAREYDDPDFKERAKRIFDLRFKLADAPTPSKAYPILTEILAEIREQFKRYGREGDNTYASQICQGSFDPVVSKLEEVMAAETPSVPYND